MKIDPAVNWQEGMFLSPCHFQQAERHLKSELNARIRHGLNHPWGLYELDYDARKLEQGVFSLHRLAGVSRQGLAFDLYEDGAVSSLPKERSFEDFFEENPGLKHISVYVALPKERPYAGSTLTVRENNNIQETVEVEIRHPAFQLLFDPEVAETDALEVMKIVEVVGKKGAFQLASEYTPPVLRLAYYSRASFRSYLSEIIQDVVRMIERRIHALRATIAGAHEQDLALRASLSTYHVPMLQALSGALPVLRHLDRSGECHPETLYVELVATLGRLTAHSSDGSGLLDHIPEYDHEALGAGFGRLREIYRHVLAAREFKADTVVAIPMALEEVENKQVLTAAIGDRNGFTGETLLEQADWFIKLHAQNGAKELFLHHIRVSSPDVIRQVIVFAAKNSLELLDREGYVPPGAASEPGVVYYQLKKNGRNWEAICAASAISIYATNETVLEQVDHELVAVVQGTLAS